MIRLGTAPGRWVLAATIGGSGLAMLDGTVVNVALRSIGEDLHADFTELQWTVNAYTLTLAALILLGGSLGDRFGRRRVFLIGVVWFAITSAICALSPTIEVLIAARALQGVGGALLTPGSLAIISASFAPRDRAKAIGLWSGLGGVAGALGPILGGWLVALDWRLVFLINLPIAGLVVFAALRHVPDSRADAGPIDRWGAALAVLGLGGVTYALTSLDAGALPITVGAVVGVASMVGFLLVQRRVAAPLVPLRLFANRVFTTTNVATFAVYAALGIFFLLLVLQLQTVSGFSPAIAGASMLPSTALMMLLSARSGALADRIGPRPQMTIGPLVAACGFLLCRRIGPDAQYVTEVLPAVLTLGLGLSITVAPLTSTVLAAAPAGLAGTASGVNNAIARTAGLLAVAVIPTISGVSSGYGDPAQFDRGFDTAMTIGAGLLVVAAAISAVCLPAGPHRARRSFVHPG